jgi:type II restriction enzyme
VASSGPISAARLVQLESLVEQCVSLGVRLHYVTVFPSRRIFRRFVEDIAWGTDVWIADEPEHIVRFGTA